MNLLLDDRTQSLVEYYLPDNSVLNNLAEFFSVFSDSTRIKILSALSITEMCVTDLSEILKINQTTVSHQLKILRSAGVVGFRREGKIIFYYLSTGAVEDVMLSGVRYLGY